MPKNKSPARSVLRGARICGRRGEHLRASISRIEPFSLSHDVINHALDTDRELCFRVKSAVIDRSLCCGDLFSTDRRESIHFEQPLRGFGHLNSVAADAGGAG